MLAPIYIALALGAACIAGAAYWGSRVMTARYPYEARRTPRGAEQLWMASGDVRLRVWLLRGAASGPAVLIVPGLHSQVDNYAALAENWHDLGYSALLLEPRGHGESGGFPTLGARETNDVRTALAFMAARGLTARGVVLAGFSLGAVAVLRAAVGQRGIRAVVVEAPFHSLREAVPHTARLMYGIPRWLSPLSAMSLWLAARRGRFRCGDIHAGDAAEQLEASLLVIADGADPWTPPSAVHRVWARHPGPKTLWIAPDAAHVEASSHSEYWPRVQAFLALHGASDDRESSVARPDPP